MNISSVVVTDTMYTHFDSSFPPQEQDTLGDAEERCTQLMHQKVQLEESVQVIYHEPFHIRRVNYSSACCNIASNKQDVT